MTPRDLLLLLFLGPAAGQAANDGEAVTAPTTPAQEQVAVQPPAAPARTSDLTTPARTSALAGRQVVGSDGQSLGEIVDYALDEVGRAYALLDTDGAAPGDLAMVPHGALQFRSDSDALVYTGTLAKLQRTPVAER